MGRSSATPAVRDRIVMRAYASGGVDDGDGKKRQEPACQAGGNILAAIEGVTQRAVVGIVRGRRMMLAGLRHSLNRRRRPLMEVGLDGIGLQKQRQRGAGNQKQAPQRPPRHRRLMRFDCRPLHARSRYSAAKLYGIRAFAAMRQPRDKAA